MYFFMLQFIVGVYYNEGPPVPIPNTVVKLICAEDTWRVAAWENRFRRHFMKASDFYVRGFFLTFSAIVAILELQGVKILLNCGGKL